MAAFLSAAAAVRCASRALRELERHRRENAAHPIRLRIGAAAGEPVEHRNDLFGSTVQLAARLCSHAGPDQILVSETIIELCAGKGLRFQDLGEVSLKGFERPVHVHAVDWPGDAG
jgi:class 3 adenylate cyclase